MSTTTCKGGSETVFKDVTKCLARMSIAVKERGEDEELVISATTSIKPRGDRDSPQCERET